MALDVTGSGRFIAIITGAISIVSAIIGAAVTFFVVSSNVQNQVIIDSTRLNALDQSLRVLAEHDASVTAQFNGLSSRLINLESLSAQLLDRNTINQNEIVSLTSDLREIETQFCASDIIRNLMHANDLRTMSVLWVHTFKERYPTDNAYYPQICNRDTKSTTPNTK
jgi:hypothetical protein